MLVAVRQPLHNLLQEAAGLRLAQPLALAHIVQQGAALKQVGLVFRAGQEAACASCRMPEISSVRILSSRHAACSTAGGRGKQMAGGM